MHRIAAPFVALFAAPALAGTPEAEIPAEITAYVAANYGQALDLYSFTGDFTGDGRPDAIAFIYYPFEGGNSFGIEVSLFRNENGRLVHLRTVDDVFGTEPRNARIRKGRIEVTTTMPKPGDPRCCPTGQRRWQIRP
ncbi:MAG TPA: hypothetical protein VFR34_01660 [Paracoccaceae bacterium]|nr:hypothetical protein [Paracoccaceae bacterium]